MQRNRFVRLLAAASLAVVAFAPAASASDVTIASGTLSLTSAPTAGNFTTVTLNGAAQTTTAALSLFEVTDARGTGAGWNVNVTATAFREHDGTAYVVSGKSLATGSLSMSAPTVTADGTTSAAPGLTAGPYAVDVSGGVKIASAATNTGMGAYDFSASTLTLSVPASAYAKTYRSDVTVSVVTGP